MNTYVVIDVEMCGVQMRTQNFNRKHEIVQIGAVMMNEAYEIIDSFTTFVRPDYGKIDYFISSLTGIANKDVKRAPGLAEALQNMMEWFGDRRIRFYAWSNTDYNQIRGEILDKKLDEETYAIFLNKENWVDYQHIVNVRFKIGRSLALSDALQMTELDVDGRLHDGLADAMNTARIISKLEQNPDYKCTLEKLREKESKSEPLTTSLGSLLKGIRLD